MPFTGLLAAAGPNQIDKYLYLRQLRATRPLLYHSLMLAYVEDVLPYIYTPTVGQACQEYHTLGITPRGLYLNLDD
ncbi:NAD-dependent malic enzyme, partial [Tetrabaena socialis]